MKTTQLKQCPLGVKQDDLTGKGRSNVMFSQATFSHRTVPGSLPTNSLSNTGTS